MSNPNKPSFRREDRFKKVRLKKRWRAPKGIHSKMRHGFRGRAPVVSTGYRIPEHLRGTDRHGKMLITVSSLPELSGIDAKKNTIIISSSVGAKKRLALLAEAQKLGLSVQNIRKPGDYVAAITAAHQTRKVKRAEHAAKKKQKHAAAKGSKPKKEAEPAEKTEEQKKEEERATQEKILTQRTA